MNTETDEEKLKRLELELADLEETWNEYLKDEAKYALALNVLGMELSEVNSAIAALRKKMGLPPKPSTPSV